MKDRNRQSSRAEAQKINSKLNRNTALLRYCSTALLLALLTGCASGLQEARDIKEAPMPPRYVETKEKEVYSTEGSLWHNRASLFEDRKAKRVNDLVTVLISEKSAASKKATTTADKDSSGDYDMTKFFGMNTDFGLQNLPMANGFYKGTNVFSPSAKGTGKSKFKGNGDTTREGTLTATITAKVVEVLPNSNLVIESRKEILVNNEKEILVFRGLIRPDNISPINTILSQYVADAQIYLIGDGVLGDKQSPGWLVRFLDKVWPF